MMQDYGVDREREREREREMASLFGVYKVCHCIELNASLTFFLLCVTAS